MSIGLRIRCMAAGCHQYFDATAEVWPIPPVRVGLLIKLPDGWSAEMAAGELVVRCADHVEMPEIKIG